MFQDLLNFLAQTVPLDLGLKQILFNANCIENRFLPDELIIWCQFHACICTLGRSSDLKFVIGFVQNCHYNELAVLVQFVRVL